MALRKRYAWPDLPKNYKKEDKPETQMKKTPKQDAEEKFPSDESSSQSSPKTKPPATTSSSPKRSQDRQKQVDKKLNHVRVPEHKQQTGGEEDAYDVDTDTEDCEDGDESGDKENSASVVPKDCPLPELCPDLFKSRRFFLFGEFTRQGKKNLDRYIVSHGGQVDPFMGPEVKYVVTRSDWSSEFDDVSYPRGPPS